MYKKNAEKAVLWNSKPDVVSIKFEKLVGIQGGGDEITQIREIIKVVQALKLQYTVPEIKKIADDLFGVKTGPAIPSLFREGKIGSWKKYFKEEHIEAFKIHLGEYQTQLGYPVDD